MTSTQYVLKKIAKGAIKIVCWGRGERWGWCLNTAKNTERPLSGQALLPYRFLQLIAKTKCSLKHSCLLLGLIVFFSLLFN